MILVRLAVLLAIVALLYLTQRFWFLNAWHWIAALGQPWLRNSLQVAWMVALVIFVLSFFDPLLGHGVSKLGGKWLIAAARVWLFASLFGFIGVQVVHGLGWISGIAASAISQSQKVDPSRRNFFRYAAYLAGGLPFLAAGYGFAAGRWNYKVEKVEVPIPDLPPELDGFRIAQLSDIHAGDYMPRDEISRAVEMANALQPDLAVVTGDFISGEYDPLGECIAELSRLHAPL
ncbi:MAG TPA: hypothetical protein VGF06_15065, partial [Terriglobales bacterium]